MADSHETGHISSDGVSVLADIKGLSSKESIATQLKNAIESENGHKGKIDISQIIKDNKKIFSIFPGSRLSEIKTLIPILFEFVKKMNKLIVVTRGKKGAIAINKNDVVECNAKKNLQIKDLTGAGDLFAGGFLHSLINNKSIKESLETGTEMSSKVIQIIGARL